MKFVWFGLGWVCVAIGGIGVVVPGLPTTIFFIGAAACFSRSSPRFEQWVLDLPTIGPMVSDYRSGLGMPMRAKKMSIGSMWVAITISVWVLDPWLLRLLLVFLGAIGTWFIALHTPTKDNDERKAMTQ